MYSSLNQKKSASSSTHNAKALLLPVLAAACRGDAESIKMLLLQQSSRLFASK